MEVTGQLERRDGQPVGVGTAGFLQKAPCAAALVACAGCFGTGKRKIGPFARATARSRYPPRRISIHRHNI